MSKLVVIKVIVVKYKGNAEIWLKIAFLAGFNSEIRGVMCFVSVDLMWNDPTLTCRRIVSCWRSLALILWATLITLLLSMNSFVQLTSHTNGGTSYSQY